MRHLRACACASVFSVMRSSDSCHMQECVCVLYLKVIAGKLDTLHSTLTLTSVYPKRWTIPCYFGHWNCIHPNTYMPCTHIDYAVSGTLEFHAVTSHHVKARTGRGQHEGKYDVSEWGGLRETVCMCVVLGMRGI